MRTVGKQKAIKEGSGSFQGETDFLLETHYNWRGVIITM